MSSRGDTSGRPALNGSARLRTGRVHEVLDAREMADLRFRSAVITSAAGHTAVLLAVVLTPLLLPQTRLPPDFTPVQLVTLQSPTPEVPEPAVEEPAPEAEPDPPATTEDTAPVPKDEDALRELREQEEEERRRLAEEEERRRLEEEERRAAEERRRAEEERRRREEEERRQPQSASRSSRSQDQRAITQSARAGGQVGVAGSSQATGLTDEEFEFAWYLDSMIKKIASRWRPPTRAQFARERVAIVYFRIDRDGNIVAGPDLYSTAGDTPYDLAAIRAVQTAAPYPPLPLQYRNNTLGVYLAFTQ